MIGAPMMGIRSVCVARMPGGEDGRREFFRTLATSRWAQCGELVIVGNCRMIPNAPPSAGWPPSSA